MFFRLLALLSAFSLHIGRLEALLQGVAYSERNLEFLFTLRKFSSFVLTRGRILGRDWDKNLKSFPPFYSQSPLLKAFGGGGGRGAPPPRGGREW